MPFDLLTKDEVAKRARISRRNLDNAIRQGRGPVLTCIGGKRLVRSDLLTEWLERCTQPAPQPVPAGLVVVPQQAAA